MLKICWKFMHRFKLQRNKNLQDPQKLKALPWQQLLSDTPQNLISSRSFRAKHVLKIWWKYIQGIGLWNTHKVQDPKIWKKALPWLLMDTPQNLISSRSFSGKHFLKIWLKSLHEFYALRQRRPGYDYNPSLMGRG